MGDLYATSVEWFADAEKLKLVMEIELQLEECFLAYNLEGLYRLIQSYIRQTKTIVRNTKGLSREDLRTRMNTITEKYTDWCEDKNNVELKALLFYEIEELFSDISYGLQSKGIYLREGKDAHKAILNR